MKTHQEYATEISNIIDFSDIIKSEDKSDLKNWLNEARVSHSMIGMIEAQSKSKDFQLEKLKRKIQDYQYIISGLNRHINLLNEEKEEIEIILQAQYE